MNLHKKAKASSITSSKEEKCIGCQKKHVLKDDEFISYAISSNGLDCIVKKLNGDKMNLYKKAKSIHLAFKRWFKVRSKIATLDNPLVDAPKAKIEESDPRNYDAYKIVAKAFENQVIEGMSMKAHASDCEIVMCKKRICFVNEPDRIIKKQTKKVAMEYEEKELVRSDGKSEIVKVMRKKNSAK